MCVASFIAQSLVLTGSIFVNVCHYLMLTACQILSYFWMYQLLKLSSIYFQDNLKS